MMNGPDYFYLLKLTEALPTKAYDHLTLQQFKEIVPLPPVFLDLLRTHHASLIEDCQMKAAQSVWKVVKKNLRKCIKKLQLSPKKRTAANKNIKLLRQNKDFNNLLEKHGRIHYLQSFPNKYPSYAAEYEAFLQFDDEGEGNDDEGEGNDDEGEGNDDEGEGNDDEGEGNDDEGEDAQGSDNEGEDDVQGEVQDDLKGEAKDDLKGEAKDHLKGEVQDDLKGEAKDDLKGEAQDHLKGEAKDPINIENIPQTRPILQPGESKSVTSLAGFGILPNCSFCSPKTIRKDPEKLQFLHCGCWVCELCENEVKETTDNGITIRICLPYFKHRLSKIKTGNEKEDGVESKE
jgi:hypothetical protein